MIRVHRFTMTFCYFGTKAGSFQNSLAHYAVIGLSIADKLHIVIFWPVFPIHCNARDYRLRKCFKGFMMRTTNKNKSKFRTGHLSFLSFQSKPREKNLLYTHKLPHEVLHRSKRLFPEVLFSLSPHAYQELKAFTSHTRSRLVALFFPLIPSSPAAAARRLSCLLNHFLITFRWDLTESARSD